MAARTGELLTYQIGKRILVPVAALERLLQGSSPHEAILHGRQQARHNLL